MGQQVVLDTLERPEITLGQPTDRITIVVVK